MNVYESDPYSLNVNYHDVDDYDDYKVWSLTDWWYEVIPVSTTEVTSKFTAYSSKYTGEFDLMSDKKTIRPCALASQDLAPIQYKRVANTMQREAFSL